MSGLGKAGLSVCTLALGLVASFFIAQGLSPVCHEGCPVTIQAAMWIFLLAMPVALAAAVGLTATRDRRRRRITATLAAFALAGVALTVAATWFQARTHGG